MLFQAGIRAPFEPHSTTVLFWNWNRWNRKKIGIGIAGTIGIAVTSGIRIAGTELNRLESHLFLCKYLQVHTFPMRFEAVVVIYAIPEPHRTAGIAGIPSTYNFFGIRMAETAGITIFLIGTAGINGTSGIGAAGTAEIAI